LNWKSLFSELPLLMSNQFPNDDQAVENFIQDVHYIATHVYMPKLGPCYCVSLADGNHKRRRQVVQTIIEDLGKPVMVSKINIANHYYWTSESREIPDPESYRRLGSDRIRDICQKHELSSADERIVKDIAVFYDVFTGDVESRIGYSIYVVSKLRKERRIAIESAIIDIMVEFAKSRTV